MSDKTFEYAEKNSLVNNTETVLGQLVHDPDPQSSSIIDPSHNNGKDRVSYAFAVFFNFILTVLCLSVTLLCVAYVLQRYLRRREERDKLYSTVSSRYWLEESRLLQAVQTLTKMRDSVLFQDVTAYSIVCYKYRSGQFETDFLSSGSLDPSSDNLKYLKYSSYWHYSDVYWALKSIERFFDSLSLQLLCRGKCTDAASRIIGPTVFHLARETSLAWSDLKSPLVHKLVGYFSGSSCAEVFRSGLISDNGLASMIISRVPYVSDLTLVSNCLLMRDVDLKFDSRIDLKGKIRFVDVFLAREESRRIFSQGPSSSPKYKFLAEACQSAKEICSRLHIMSEGALKLVETKGSPAVNVHHMLRLMCHSENLKKVQADDKFLQLLMKLYECFYNSQPQEVMETMVTNTAILEVMDRTRANIIGYLDEITRTGPRLAADSYATRVKLEQIERDLQVHLNYLILKQIQSENLDNPADISSPTTTTTAKHQQQQQQQSSSSRSPSSSQQQQQQQQQQHHHHQIQQADSDISIYTMAQSASYTARPHVYKKHHKLRHIMSNPETMDQTSLLSGASSMYATATSLSTPTESSLSSPQPAVRSQKGKNVTLSATSDSDREGFETPV